MRCQAYEFRISSHNFKLVAYVVCGKYIIGESLVRCKI